VILRIDGTEYEISKIDAQYLVKVGNKYEPVEPVPFISVSKTGRVSSDIYRPLVEVEESDKEMNNENTIVKVSDMPEGERGKWRILIQEAEKMDVGEIIRMTTVNRKDAASAQATLQGSHSSHRPKSSLRERGFRFVTKTQPVNGRKDGEWYLFVKRIA
jgi:hypothetical protein